MDVTLAKDNLVVLEQKMMNITFLSIGNEIDDNYALYRPVQFFVDSNHCPTKMLAMIKDMSDIEMVLDSMQAPQISNDTHNETRLDLSHRLVLFSHLGDRNQFYLKLLTFWMFFFTSITKSFRPLFDNVKYVPISIQNLGM